MIKHQPLNDANYNSIVDFLDAVQLPCRNAKNEHVAKHYLDGSHGSWLGADCDTGQDVIRVMRDGWQEGRERLNDLRSKIGDIDIVPIDLRRRPIRAAAGDTLDIHQVYAGRLDIAWRTARRQSTIAPRRVDIVANMICSGAEHADVLFWRGAAAATLADMLEQAGWMVRLVVNFGGMTGDDGALGGKDRCSCRIVVKDHGNPFDVASTSTVILPGFFRALGHAWIANHQTLKRDMSGIYVGEGNVEPGEIVATHNVRDHGTAAQWVHDQIAKANARGT